MIFLACHNFFYKKVIFCHFPKKENKNKNKQTTFLVKFDIKNGFFNTFPFQKCILYYTVIIRKLQHWHTLTFSLVVSALQFHVCRYPYHNMEQEMIFFLFLFFHFYFPVLKVWWGEKKKTKTYRHGPPDPNLNQLNIMYIQQSFWSKKWSPSSQCLASLRFARWRWCSEKCAVVQFLNSIFFLIRGIGTLPVQNV